MSCLCRDKGLQLPITGRFSSHVTTKSRGPGQVPVDDQHSELSLIQIIVYSL